MNAGCMLGENVASLLTTWVCVRYKLIKTEEWSAHNCQCVSIHPYMSVCVHACMHNIISIDMFAHSLILIHTCKHVPEATHPISLMVRIHVYIVCALQNMSKT